MRLWVVRAGEDLEYWPWFRDDGVIGIHFDWGHSPFDVLAADRETIRAEARARMVEKPEATIASVVGQTWAFAHEMRLDDLVVTPRDHGSLLSLGRIAGECGAAPSGVDLSFTRSVDWIGHDIRTDALKPDLRQSLVHPMMTVYLPGAAGAAERTLVVAEGGSDPGPAAYAPETRVGGWVFQCDPARYDLLTAIASGWGEDWSMNQHREEAAVGDRVWFRISGEQAGLYAVGEISSLPYRREDETEFGAWGIDVSFKALVRPPLLREEIGADPMLSQIRALAGSMGTNFPIDEAIDQHLDELLAERLRPVRSDAPKNRRSAEELNRALERHRGLVEDEILGAILELHPDAFEVLAQELLLALGFKDVKRVGAHWSGTLGDGGVDLTARMDQPGLPPLEVRAQAKRQRGNVGPGAIQQLRGALHAGQQGIFLTTSRFTRRAIEEAAAEGKPPIGRLDGPSIAQYLILHGIGVRTQSVTLPRFDPRALRERLLVATDATAAAKGHRW